ncbi:MAG TPA: helix-turn-helix transcriptional regulator [Candidatus Saccharimonadales bacterium]|nr:helix-turn-helix transcriptional regulator [Candidatus Saccharimonadales bacterium]
MVNTEDKYIQVRTGGPKKYYNKKRIRNPHYKPVKSAWTVSKYPAVEYAELLRAFRSARLAKNMTQQQLAHELRTYQAVICNFELGRTNPTVHFLSRLAEELGLTLTITAK